MAVGISHCLKGQRPAGDFPRGAQSAWFAGQNGYVLQGIVDGFTPPRVSDLLCMSNLAHASNYRSMTIMTISKVLLDELLSGVERPEDLLGDKGLIKELKVRLMERMLGAELTEHPSG